MPRQNRTASWSETARRKALGLLSFLGLLWLLLLLDYATPGFPFAQFGIVPRDLDRLWGIFLAPLLHGDFNHLLGNSFPLLILGWLMLGRGAKDFAVGTAGVVLLGGLGVWLFGRPGTVHLGASIIIFGWLGYLLAAGWYDRSVRSFLIGLVVTVVYAGPILSLLTFDTSISWEGHLFGFLAGAATARGRLGARPKTGSRPRVSTR